MECDEEDNSGAVNTSAVNSLIIDYYKKFGRKRDLEQYFSLSTAQGDVRDPTGLFWRQMKSQSDSSDSGGKRSNSPQELCRISIKCSVPDPCSSQDENNKTKSDSVSPPIITEDLVMDSSHHTDEESVKSDNGSQKSLDVLLDTSMNKPLSPTSSVNSQRKLEWDSLADVGYANESDRKTSASSLSTLERLALKQQYSNNDTGQEIGPPTNHSTPLDQNEAKSKSKKGFEKKVTKFYKKDIEFVEVNVPHISETNTSQAFNVNLTKHISFSVEKDGGVTIENVKKDVSVSPEKATVEAEVIPQIKMDKQIQTSITKEKTTSDTPRTEQICDQKIPIMISLNSLKKRHRRKKLRMAKRKLRSRKKLNVDKKNLPIQERSGEQLSEAESFEYMPGHIYNQNQMKVNESRSINTAGNKSSLESSGLPTSDSSKGSKHSFTKDLEKGIDLLKSVLQQRYDDKDHKKKLVKEVIQRLLMSKYRDDDSTTDFLSGLSFNSKTLGLEGNTTTSTSDGNNTMEKAKVTRPKKSILRMDKFNASTIASTSQSAPNLQAVISSENQVTSKRMQPLTSSNTNSYVSSKEKVSSENRFPKTSSEELYQKYLEALRREEAYKRHLKEKEIFLKQKLTSSDSAFKVPVQPDVKINKRLNDLIKDLTRNNYDDGSGDASKLEGGSNSNIDYEVSNTVSNQRSHSVFTLSSGNSECKKTNLKKRLQSDLRDLSKPSSSKDDYHYCCCPHHSANIKIGVTDSSVQVNINDELDSSSLKQEKRIPSMSCKSQKSKGESPRNMARLVSDDVTGDIKYVCLANEKGVMSQGVPDNFLIYKCSRLTNRGVQLENEPPEEPLTIGVQCANDCSHPNSDVQLVPSTSKEDKNKNQSCYSDNLKMNSTSKSSQTNLLLKMLGCKSSDKKTPSTSDTKKDKPNQQQIKFSGPKIVDYPAKQVIHEATRCIQTEISINPQISDPSLSDINIVNVDCVKLISEQFKEVSKRNSEADVHNREAQSDVDTQQKARRNASSGESVDDISADVNTSSGISARSGVKEIQSNIGKYSEFQPDVIQQYADSPSDNFIIPIQGTNMTLMVSIGSKEPTAFAETLNNQEANENLVTEGIDYAAKSTSNNDECRNHVQYKINSVNSEQNANNSNIEKTNFNSDIKKSCQMNTYLTSCDPKFNTYPNISHVNEKKPLLRSNTVTEKMGSGVQTDKFDKEDVAIPQNFVHDFIKPMQKPMSSGSSDNSAGHSTSDSKPKNLISKRGTAAHKHSLEKTHVSKDDINNQQKCACGCSTSSHCAGVCNEKNDIKEEVQSNEPSPSYNLIKTQPQPKIQSDTEAIEIHSSQSSSDSDNQRFPSKDPILDLIKDITRRYSKRDMEKNNKNKCFKDIVTVLNHLLDTDESTDREQAKASESSNIDCNTDQSKSECQKKPLEKVSEHCQTTALVDKGVQLSRQSKSTSCNRESSNLPTSTDIPTTSSDSATCKVLSKIKKECDKYHQKRCKSHAGKKCEASSTTSVNCEQCRRVHHCPCRLHKCKGHRSKANDKCKKKSVAYNLIIQTSESMMSEETVCDNNRRPLRNIVVKVPSRCMAQNVPFKEMEAKIGKKLHQCSPRCDTKCQRSKSMTNESKSSTDDCVKREQTCTVREYLERNRPDFVEKASQRQTCMKMFSESRDQDPCASPHLKMVVVHTPNCMGSIGNCNMYCGGVPMTCNQYVDSCNPCMQNIQTEVTRIANERAAHRELLSVHVDGELPLSSLYLEELRHLAQEIGVDLTRNKRTKKFMSERDMKKHSEKIYKSLPEVVHKKEEIKKENIKKTNLLMANIFKKNLQRKTLRGAVNISNYSTVIKI